MDNLSLAQKFSVWVLPVVFAITVHEVAHGWVASKLGDNTARQLGRLTLNPFKHIDLVGTIIVPGILLALGGFLFGWAKPVPVNWRNLKNPKTDMIWVAIAGPTANVIMAIFWVGVVGLNQPSNGNLSFASSPLVYVGAAGVYINLILLVLNLLPIPSLDGSRVVAGFLPDNAASKYYRLERWGFPILVAMMAIGWLEKIISPPIFYGLELISNLANVPLLIMHQLLYILLS